MKAGGLDRIVWDRVPSNAVTDGIPHVLGTLYANEDAGYLTTRISRQFGDVVAYRFKAPTFAGSGSPAPQLRYWSLCEYEFYTQRYIQCSPDFRTTVDADGYARFVISDPEERP